MPRGGFDLLTMVLGSLNNLLWQWLGLVIFADHEQIVDALRIPCLVAIVWIGLFVLLVCARLVFVLFRVKVLLAPLQLLHLVELFASFLDVYDVKVCIASKLQLGSSLVLPVKLVIVAIHLILS